MNFICSVFQKRKRAPNPLIGCQNWVTSPGGCQNSVTSLGGCQNLNPGWHSQRRGPGVVWNISTPQNPWVPIFCCMQSPIIKSPPDDTTLTALTILSILNLIKIRQDYHRNKGCTYHIKYYFEYKCRGGLSIIFFFLNQNCPFKCIQGGHSLGDMSPNKSSFFWRPP